MELKRKPIGTVSIRYNFLLIAEQYSRHNITKLMITMAAGFLLAAMAILMIIVHTPI